MRLLILAALLAPPIPGGVVRPFDYGPDPFAAGQHRGVDLRGRLGAAVRAPCRGRVVFAGPVAGSGATVTLRCGPWRVTLSPLEPIRTRSGARVAAGTPLGSLAADALNLGVRRAGDRSGYVDPLPLLAARSPPAGPAPLPEPIRPPAPRLPTPRPLRAPRPPPAIPWPLWLGAALVATASTAGVAVRRRWRRVSSRRFRTAH